MLLSLQSNLLTLLFNLVHLPFSVLFSYFSLNLSILIPNIFVFIYYYFNNYNQCIVNSNNIHRLQTIHVTLHIDTPPKPRPTMPPIGIKIYFHILQTDFDIIILQVIILLKSWPHLHQATITSCVNTKSNFRTALMHKWNFQILSQDTKIFSHALPH